MALKATIYKATLNVTDMVRHVYEEFSLTLACHPSETEARMLLRLLAFALYADERLEFGRGISTDDEPDLWQKSLSGEIELWIDLGIPDESRIRKACGRASQVVLLVYGERSAQVWWPKNSAQLERFKNLVVLQISDSSMQELANLAGSNMALQCVIDEGQMCLTSSKDDALLTVELHELKR